MIHALVKYNVYSSLLFLLFHAFAYTQNPHPAFRQYTVEDGLPSSEVYQIKQDSKGYIWFATGNGVSRFNGYEFENFSMNNGLPDNTVFDIFEDHKGRIWFVPISCKLSYYENGKIYPFRYNDNLQKLLKNPIKASFSIDKKGNIFLGVKMDGIYKISENGQITHINTPDVAINVLQIDTDKIVYSSTLSDTKNTIEFNTSQIQGITILKDSVEGFNLSSSLIKTQKNSIVFPMNQKLYNFTSINDHSMISFPRRIIWVSEDNEEDLWIGTDLGGVYHIQQNDFKNKTQYLPDISVNSVMQDKEGGFWFASEYNGAFYTPSKYILTYDNHSGLKDSKINSLTKNGDDIYVGLPSGFVHKINDEEITTYNCNPKGQTGNYITKLHYDPLTSQLWVAGKLQCGKIKNETFIHNDVFGFFNTIMPTSKDEYLLAHSNGLYVIKEEKIKFNAGNSIFPARRRSEAMIKNDTSIFVGAIDGLWKKNVADRLFVYEGDTHPLLQNRILDLDFVSDSILAIATKGAGLVLYHPKEIHQIDTRNGLYSNNVNKISVDAPHIWVATDNGLNKITITKNKPYPVTGFTTADGIASNEVIDVARTQHKIWVATNKGLSVFYPDQPRKDTAPLPIYIRSVLINETAWDLRKKYTLEHHQNNIKIRFIGLGYKNAGKLRYKYKMTGLDTTWTDTQNREIQYTTLPPGKYTFAVSVLNANNKWNTTTAEIQFNIAKPYWKEWWFRIALVVLVSMCIFLLVKQRVKQIKAKEAKNSALNKNLLHLKLKALRAQMNPHFTFNVINSIQHFILHNDTELAYRYLSKFSKLVRVILSNSEKNTISIKEEIKALTLYLDLEAMRFEKQFDYTIVIDPSIDTKTTTIPSMLLQPYVENAIKHGILPLKDRGKITIEIQKQSRLLRCSIEDNGIGRAEAAKHAIKGHRSMGTAITKNRLIVINELNNSNLSERTTDLLDEDKNPRGTRVEIFIPIH